MRGRRGRSRTETILDRIDLQVCTMVLDPCLTVGVKTSSVVRERVTKELRDKTCSTIISNLVWEVSICIQDEICILL